MSWHCACTKKPVACRLRRWLLGCVTSRPIKKRRKLRHIHRTWSDSGGGRYKCGRIRMKLFLRLGGMVVISGLVGSKPSFTITLTSPFSYDPTSGNLLLEVIASDQSNFQTYSGNWYLAADSTGTTTSRVWSYGASTILNHDLNGLVTT